MRCSLLAAFRLAPVCKGSASIIVRAAARALVAVVWLHASVLVVAPAAAFAGEPVADQGDIVVAQLPPQARDVLLRVRAGGPFPYERDGATFGNRERLLPVRKRGFYHEYTVETPGARNRGARRIICGGPRRAPEVCYYTDDHYASFRRIRE